MQLLEEVRLQAISSLPEVMRQLGVEHSQQLFRAPLKQLLADESVVVRQHLYTRLGAIVEFLYVPSNSPVRKNCILNELLTTALRHAETQTKSANWRATLTLLNAIENS